MPHARDIRIRSNPCELASVREQVREVAIAIGFGDQDVSAIALAVDEALANVIRHGYGGPCEKPIDIRIERTARADADAINVTIRDFGKQSDASQFAGRALEDVRPGGLGVHIIKTVMDEVRYEPAEGGGMALTMVKKIIP